MTTKASPFLMFNEHLGPAVELYTSIFPDSKVINLAQQGENGPVMSAEFIVGGQRFMAFNGGPHFKFSDAFSIFINCEDQQEVDRYWDRLLDGGQPSQCGWLKDRFGVSWQVIPDQLGTLLQQPDRAKAARVMQAMMGMVKLDIAALEAASAG